MWTIEYRPKSLKEFVNQQEAVNTFLRWIKSWKPGDNPLLFYGPPGTGKTCLIQAYAQEKNLEFIETNASDVRSAKALETIATSTQQRPFLKKSKIFLFDEIEGIIGRVEVGGVRAILELIKKSSFPIVLIANNPWDPKLRSLRELCKLVEFKKISIWDIEKRLKRICELEGTKPEKEVIRELAKISKGDLRAAINDLETVARGKKKITVEDLKILGFREKEISVFDALKIIFKTEKALAAKLAISNVDKDPEEIFLWIENNIANEYEKPEEIANAYDALSKADLFRQWIRLRQEWRFKGYMIDLMTAGVSQAKKAMYRKFVKYKYPSKLIVLGRTKIERAEEKEKLLELAKQLHCSTRKVRSEFLPYLKILAKT
ncbi:MAG: replication factor C large subunit [Candidatus Aenigmarchaeota archaeon]|nr:replication factor C large subunit [Candidatus Aenigmarchaeota archaeon]